MICSPTYLLGYLLFFTVLRRHRKEDIHGRKKEIKVSPSDPDQLTLNLCIHFLLVKAKRELLNYLHLLAIP